MHFEDFAEGYKDFYKKYFDPESTEKKLYEELATGQSPDTLLISCSDSRVDPNLIIGSKPGEVFCIRNIAAIVPPYDPKNHYHGTNPALEYAIKVLKVKNIVIMGHSSCGGCHALANHAETKEKFEFIAAWVKKAKPAFDKVNKELPKNASPEIRSEALEQAVILESINSLMTFPWVKDAVKKGELELHGLCFNIETGSLLEYNKQTSKFVEMDKSTPAKHPINDDRKKPKIKKN